MCCVSVILGELCEVIAFLSLYIFVCICSMIRQIGHSHFSSNVKFLHAKGVMNLMMAFLNPPTEMDEGK